MKVAWTLLLSLVLVFLLEDCDAWGFRTPRFRIALPRVRISLPRVRMALPRVRLALPRVRLALPTVRGSNIFRNFKNLVTDTIQTIRKVVITTHPHLFIAKQIFDRLKAKKMIAVLTGKPCVADVVCGGACANGKCFWHCDNLCKILPSDQQFNWPGDLVELPCQYSEYDYTGIGYFSPSDLAYHIKERGREPDNMMVFRRLDQNGDGRVTASEFRNTKKYLLIDQNTC
ncbi:uncharacterized protein [Mytilus edulis]|uniref:uncharacterized protein n=1 Tax=Mytilus edulis TaxID=6550 RepID=UPI0039F081C5